MIVATLGGCSSPPSKQPCGSLGHQCYSESLTEKEDALRDSIFAVAAMQILMILVGGR
jgi:hypothetical protein